MLFRSGASGWTFDGAPEGGVFVEGGTVTVFAAYGLRFDVVDPLAQEAEAAAGGATLAPMPGRVVSVHVHPGQAVTAGDRLAVLEAMKMEHTLTASVDGVVAEVLVREGDQVEAGAPLVVLDEAE